MKTDLASTLFNAIVPAPFGAIGLRSADGRVLELVYLQPSFQEKAADNDVAGQAARQVAQYLEDPDFRFDLQLAKTIGSAPRAVGQACGANPFPLINPCHRVTASGGLGGFSNQDDENGFHLSVKRWLLRHEGATASPWQQQSIWD